MLSASKVIKSKISMYADDMKLYLKLKETETLTKFNIIFYFLISKLM